MTEVNLKSQNIEAHYSTNSKITKPEARVVAGPPYVQNKPVFSDKEANKRICALNEDVYQQSKKEKKSDFRKFWIVFLSSIAVIATTVGLTKGIKRIFKKS